MMAATRIATPAETIRYQISNSIDLSKSERRSMITINTVAGHIWELLESTLTVEEIVDRCRVRYPDVEAEVISEDVRSFLQHAVELGLVRLAN